MVDRPDVEAPRGVEPTGTNSRTATHTPAHTGWQEQTKASLGRQGDTLHVTWINPSVASTIRSPTRHDPPREHVETRSRGMYNTRFAAAMAQGRRPDPFRTRKLRPGTAMVLHLEGCGRVARRRTQTLKGRGHHSVPPPFSHTPDTTAIAPPDTRTWNKRAKPGQPPAHPDHEPASEAPHTRQARHTGTKDYCLRRSIPSRMRRHTQPRRKTPGNDTIARHPPARACPRIHNDALPAHRASRTPASGIRRMPRHTHLKKLPGPHGKPGRTPAAGKDTGHTPDATTRPRPQHPQGSSAKPPVPICHRHTPNKPATPDHPSA